MAKPPSRHWAGWQVAWVRWCPLSRFSC